MTERPPELPLPEMGNDELTTLVDYLNHQRHLLRRKTRDLDAVQLAQPLLSSTLTIGGLVKHMAIVEDGWFQQFAGQPEPEHWASAPWAADRDWEFNSARDDTLEQLLTWFDESIARSNAVIAAAGDPDAISAHQHRRRGEHFTLRWMLVHMIEEYARHIGHADLIRESIDGVVGD